MTIETTTVKASEPLDVRAREKQIEAAKDRIYRARTTLQVQQEAFSTDAWKAGVEAAYLPKVESAEQEAASLVSEIDSAIIEEIDRVKRFVDRPKALTDHQSDLYDMRRDRWKEDIGELSHLELMGRVERAVEKKDTVDMALIARYLPKRLEADAKKPQDAWDTEPNFGPELHALLAQAREKIVDPAPRGRIEELHALRDKTSGLDRKVRERPQSTAVRPIGAPKPGDVPWLDNAR